MEQYDLNPYQQVLLDRMSSGGFRAGELMTIASGSGKSMLNNLCESMITPHRKFQITDQAQVDGATWYTITCVREVSEWIRKQPEELQYSHIDKNWTIYHNKFDMHENLYSILALKWS